MASTTRSSTARNIPSQQVFDTTATGDAFPAEEEVPAIEGAAGHSSTRSTRARPARQPLAELDQNEVVAPEPRRRSSRLASEGIVDPVDDELPPKPTSKGKGKAKTVDPVEQPTVMQWKDDGEEDDEDDVCERHVDSELESCSNGEDEEEACEKLLKDGGLCGSISESYSYPEAAKTAQESAAGSLERGELPVSISKKRSSSRDRQLRLA